MPPPKYTRNIAGRTLKYALVYHLLNSLLICMSIMLFNEMESRKFAGWFLLFFIFGLPVIPMQWISLTLATRMATSKVITIVFNLIFYLGLLLAIATVSYCVTNADDLFITLMSFALPNVVAITLLGIPYVYGLENSQWKRKRYYADTVQNKPEE